MMNLSSAFLLFCLVGIAYGATHIEQVHISLGSDETEMVVTWTQPGSKHAKDHGKVLYGENKGNLDKEVNAEVEQLGHKFTTFRALLTGLKPGTSYNYAIQMGNVKSDILHFKTLKHGEEWLPRFAIYGDLGYVNERSLPYLSKDVDKDMFDVIFHIGDFAYDLHDNDGETGNKFMRSIEHVASLVPYMTCPGNHERHKNFSHYDARFSMIGDRYSHHSNKDSLKHRLNNHFHSMDIGPVHIVMFSTEYYYYTEYGWEQIERQYRWLEQDLIRANQNRKQRPWIIAMGHRPLYCLKIGDDSCNHQTLERERLRQGVHMHGRGERKYSLEELFFKHGVDIQFYGHEHFYARLLPIYKYEKKIGHNSKNPYDHPDGPVHITTGSAGNKELHPDFNHLQDWVAHHFYDYGYTRLMFEDKYKIRLQQVSDDENGKVMDEIVIVKSSPKPHWMIEE